jgi:hypothetical protein
MIIIIFLKSNSGVDPGQIPSQLDSFVHFVLYITISDRARIF